MRLAEVLEHVCLAIDDAAAIRERRRLLSPCLAAPSGIPGFRHSGVDSEHQKKSPAGSRAVNVS
jgi:hypothetical protein